MSAHAAALTPNVRETVPDLRRRLGLFSFRHDPATAEGVLQEGRGPCPDLGLRPGAIVEWLVETPGAGAIASALQMMSQPQSQASSTSAHGVLAIVDAARECYAPALSGWGISPSRTLLVCPPTQQEAFWAIEQCLRCPGVSATWAWVDQRIPTRVRRRWQLAAELGGGVGLFFRPESARRESAWADLRLLVTPLAGGREGGQGETRRVRIDVLYRRGGLGGTAQVWEIDHAQGVVRLVPEVVDPTIAERAARA
jgi:protein ImuA